MATAEEKIKALIAKALSTENQFPEEARTCALNAVRLIEKYKTRLSDVALDWDCAPPSDTRVLNLERELNSALVRLGLTLEEKQRAVAQTTDLQKDLERMSMRVRQLERRLESAKKKPAKKNKAGKYRSVSFDIEDVGDDEGRTITARYESCCGNCGHQIQPGERMLWRPGRSNLCPDCWGGQ